MTVFEKSGLILAAGVILCLIGLIVFSRNGFLDYRDLREKEAAVSRQNMATKKANRKIEKQINSLKTDVNYIKHLAKHEHEMAERDELIFKTPPKGKGDRP